MYCFVPLMPTQAMQIFYAKSTMEVFIRFSSAAVADPEDFDGTKV